MGHSEGSTVCPGRILLIGGVDSLRDAKQVLQVVAELVSDDVRLPEIVDAEALGHQLDEEQVTPSA